MAELIPIPFASLLKRVFHEHRVNKAVFDLPIRKFYQPSTAVDMTANFCGHNASNPVGPAAGPQTQLAQNLALSWLAGSRILELKTVQINDRLTLSRPCIDIATIGYNTEWSQELTLEESAREYVKGRMLIQILGEWLFPGNNRLDTIFDLSVGYDLAGIQSPQIRAWLGKMLDASGIIEELRKEIPDEFASMRDLPFTEKISDSITLSTFHGTPADEIERICEFLIAEMGFHVIVKMNPPMLGKQRLEHLLYEKLGYTDVEVNENAYKVNISFNDAAGVVRRLHALGARHGKTVGVKFGNTLEVINKRNYLQEKVQYLSGQPLHILHLALVDDWRKEFGPEFPISFSAGVDANNFADCVAIGMSPITTCTDLLRPGGYGRLPQYLANLEHRMKESGASTIDEFITRTADVPSRGEAILKNTRALLAKSIEMVRYHHEQNMKFPRKIGSTLHLWDCINCDKCVPVCPNDANFYFEIEPFDIEYRNIEITSQGWQEIEGGPFSIAESHQIANFADACNECGNCDVFCPEDGGPYIEKPRFFGTLDGFKRFSTLSGFYLAAAPEGPLMYGRFKDQEYVLRHQAATGTVLFEHAGITAEIDPVTGVVQSVVTASVPLGTLLDMRYYFAMYTLMKGMLQQDRVHFVNVGLSNFTSTELSHA